MCSKDFAYTSNSELGFDYLRENMVRNISNKAIRGLTFAIIDEGDAILIGEARTSLFISGMPKVESKFYLEEHNFVKTLYEEDYLIHSESKSIFLSEEGAEKVEKHFKLKNLYSVESADIVHKITNVGGQAALGRQMIDSTA